MSIYICERCGQRAEDIGMYWDQHICGGKWVRESASQPPAPKVGSPAIRHTAWWCANCRKFQSASHPHGDLVCICGHIIATMQFTEEPPEEALALATIQSACDRADRTFTTDRYSEAFAVIRDALSQAAKPSRCNPKAGEQVTPKPRECWVRFNKNGSIDASRTPYWLEGSPPVHMGEVLNGEAPSPPKGLVWTKEKPKAEGWYWRVIITSEDHIHVIEHGGTLYFQETGVCDASDITNMDEADSTWQWAGPIEPPEPKEIHK